MDTVERWYANATTSYNDGFINGLNAAVVAVGGDNSKEQLAALCHRQWSGWMDYLFSKCREIEDGELVIPTWAVERWKRQVDTPYAELSEQEKDNDRAEADRFITLMETIIDDFKRDYQKISKSGGLS